MNTTVARVRAREVSPAGFLQLAILSVASLYLVVTTGAVVRLTASGLGCDNWPRCGNLPFPEKGGHAAIEFSNRVVAVITIAVTLVSWIAARRTAGLPGWLRWAAFAVFAGSLAQIPLGGLTVIFDLNPVLVLMHFLLALAVLGLALVVALEAWAHRVGHGARARSWWLRSGGLVLAVSCLVLVVTGTVVTASGPHSGGQDIRRLGVLQNAVYVHVRASAVFGVGVLIVGWLLLRHRAELPGVARLGAFLLGILVVQMAVGEIQYRTHLPWWLVLVHVGLAAAVWGATVVLVTCIWRPPAPLTAH